MPPTAKGFAFLTLEDEEGLMNIVLRPDAYAAFRQQVRLEPMLFVEGIVENKDGVVNVMARNVIPLSACYQASALSDQPTTERCEA
jgi:error-prone DNA polymerase